MNRAFLFVVVFLAACSDGSSPQRDNTAPIIALMGVNPQIIEAGSDYVELGATATDDRDGSLTHTIAIDASQVNTLVPGSYTVTYSVTDSAGNTGRRTRTVSVQDSTPPVLLILGDDPIRVSAGDAYPEPGATAFDSLDGDITASIVVDASSVDTSTPGDYTVTYSVNDAAGNGAMATRTVSVADLTPPVLTLLGADPQLVEGGAEYVELGASAADNVDGNLSMHVQINSGSVNTLIPGDYSVTYEVSDSAGNASAIARTVRVVDTTPPVISLLGDDPQAIVAGEPYVELSATAVDAVDGDLSESVTIDTTDIDLDTSGDYVVTYAATDSRGNKATRERLVRVLMTGSWRTLGNTRAERVDHTATLLPDGRVLLIGGTLIEVFDPSTEQSEVILDTNEAPSRQSKHTSTLLSDGRVLIAGGENGGYLSLESNAAHILDPIELSLVPLPPMNEHREDHTATLLHDGRILIAGGKHTQSHDSAELFDPVSGQFSATGSLNKARHKHTATLLEDGTVLIVGGFVMAGPNTGWAPAETSVEIFDPATGLFREVATLPDHRIFHSATLMPDGKVLIAGGYLDIPGGASRWLNTIIFDVGSGTFLPAGELEQDRYLHAAVALNSSLTCEAPAMVVGGERGYKSDATLVELFDPVLKRYYVTDSLNIKRQGHTATLLADGRVLVTGGYSDLGSPGRSVEIFEPAGSCN